MAMAARRERGLLDPDAAPGETLFDHHDLRAVQRRRHRGGRQRRGLVDRRHPAARQPHPDLRRQPDLDRGRHQHRPQRGRRRALRGLRLARAGRRLDPRRQGLPRGRPGAVRRRSSKAEAVTDQPSFIVLRTIIAWPAPNAQNTGKAHGSALGDDEVAATKKMLGFDPDQTFEVAAEVIEHTRAGRRARQGGAGRLGRASSTPGRRSPAAARRCSTGCRPAPCPTAGPTPCRRSTPTRRAWPPARRPAT